MQILIQGLTVFCALAINFLVPMVYGVDTYGEFLKQNISVLVVHKFTDIVLEPLIAYLESKLIFFSSLLMSVVIIVIIYATGFYTNDSSLELLMAMLMSSNCILSMFALRLNKLLVFHLIGVAAAFLALLLLERTNIYHIDLIDLMFWANFLPAICSTIGIIFSGAEFPRMSIFFDVYKVILYTFPKNISTTFVFNLLTNIYPYILAKKLTALDMGMFRVSTSILQSATSLFPINQKAIFSTLVLGVDRDDKFKYYMAVSLLYFCTIGFVCLLTAKWVQDIQAYVTMITMLPILYWGVLLERLTQATGNHRMLSVLNLLLGGVLLLAITFVNDLYDAELAYCVGLGLYTLGLIYVSKIECRKPAYLLMITLSILGFVGGDINKSIDFYIICIMILSGLIMLKSKNILFACKLLRK